MVYSLALSLVLLYPLMKLYLLGAVIEGTTLCVCVCVTFKNFQFVLFMYTQIHILEFVKIRKICICYASLGDD